MTYWIDVDNCEYGMVADPGNLHGLAVSVDGGLTREDCERFLACARENGAILLVEAMAEMDALIRALESLSMTFIFSPVPPTFLGKRATNPARTVELDSFGRSDGLIADLQEAAA